MSRSFSAMGRKGSGRKVDKKREPNGGKKRAFSFRELSELDIDSLICEYLGVYGSPSTNLEEAIVALQNYESMFVSKIIKSYEQKYNGGGVIDLYDGSHYGTENLAREICCLILQRLQDKARAGKVDNLFWENKE